jgi:hypothetical protein
LYLSVGYFVFVYNATYSEGVRSGQTNLVVKGWFLKLGKAKSARDLEHKSFFFSFRQKKVITDLQEFEGKYVKVKYVERYKTLLVGRYKYFIIDVKEEDSTIPL